MCAHTCMCSVAQLCPALWDSVDCSLLGSSVYGIILAGILEWAAIPFSKGPSQPRDWTHIEPTLHLQVDCLPLSHLGSQLHSLFTLNGLLLLLLSHFSHVWLCVTPSLGFSRQEHWSGFPFPSPMHESEKWKWSHSVVSNSSRPHGLQPTRVLRPWDFPGKSTGVGAIAFSVKWFSG